MTNTTLFEQLMDLCESSDAFYFQDHVLDERNYRIFNYRLCSYTDFLKPSAIECRGIMFEINSQGGMLRLAARPMAKFFNLGECPITMNLNLQAVDSIEHKMDGSLITSYIHNNQLRLKSKGSLSSAQAQQAESWIKTVPELYDAVLLATLENYSVNMEWCSIENRIVISYAAPSLTVLNVRNMVTGAYMSRHDMLQRFGGYVVPNLVVNDSEIFINSISAITEDIEGYVARIGDLWFKIKTQKYLSLHHLKDDIANPKKVAQVIVDEGIDDFKAAFHSDTVLIELITRMEVLVSSVYNHITATVTDFYTANKHLDRKSYAIKGQSEMGNYFSLCMAKYIGREMSVKEYIMKNFDDLFGDKTEFYKTQGTST